VETYKRKAFEEAFHVAAHQKLYDLVYKQGVEDTIVIDVWDADDVKLNTPANSIGILGESESEVNDELVRLYEVARELVRDDLEQETRKALPIKSGESVRMSFLYTWQGEDGWYACVGGETRDGLYFEGEDMGPFESREEAIDQQDLHFITDEEDGDGDGDGDEDEDGTPPSPSFTVTAVQPKTEAHPLASGVMRTVNFVCCTLDWLATRMGQEGRKDFQDVVIEVLEQLVDIPSSWSFRMWRDGYRESPNGPAWSRMNWIALQIGLLTEHEYRRVS
jgi:hypothetical protein